MAYGLGTETVHSYKIVYNGYNASYSVSGIDFYGSDLHYSIPTFQLTEIEKLRKELKEWTLKVFDECKLC